MIIGVTGTNGAGKGTVVDYLVQKGFTHYSVRELLINEIKRRGLPVDRPSMREVGNDLRAKNAPGYFIEFFSSDARSRGITNFVIESLRSVGEADALKKAGGILVAVDADRPVRYDRAVLRGSDTDKVDFETWVEQEKREWDNTDPNDMNVSKVVSMADETIINNGTVDELQKQIDEVLAKISA